MRATRLAVSGMLLLAVVAGGAKGARADAALAVGQPADVATHGIAVGWAVDYMVRTEAEKQALAQCRDFKDAGQAARDACRIVETFRDGCVVVAFDPERGTKGVGWGVHKSQDWAEDAAMERCAEASPPARRSACRVALVRCDGR